MLTNRLQGFGLIELMLAITLMLVLSLAGVGLVSRTYSTNRLASDTSEAGFYAQEGIEAVRSLKNKDWANLDTGGVGCTDSITGGVEILSNEWNWKGTADTFSDYTRSITIQNVCRDTFGDVVASGGTYDPNIKRVTSTVDWNFSSSRANSSELVTYLTNWEEAITFTPSCDWTQATIVQTADTPESNDPNELYVEDPYAYVVSDRQKSGVKEEFNIIDLSDVYNSTTMSGLKTGSNTLGIWNFGDTSYITTAGTEIRTVDITNKLNPVFGALVRDLPTGANSKGIVATTNHLITARATANGTGVDYSEILLLDRPTLNTLDGYELNAISDKVFVLDNYVYATSRDNTKELLELSVSGSIPYTLTYTGSYNSQDRPNGTAVFAEENNIYLGTTNNTGSHNGLEDGEFYILSSSHVAPNPFALVGQYDVGATVYDIYVNDIFAFLATDKVGAEVIILNISDPNNITEVISFDLGGRSKGVKPSATQCRIYAISDNDSAEFAVIEDTTTTGGGPTGGGGGGTPTSEADYILEDLTSLDAKKAGPRSTIEKLLITNITAADTATLIEMTLTWTGSSTIEQIKNGSNAVIWSGYGVSGDLLNVDDQIIGPGTTLTFASFRFVGNITNETITIDLHFADGTTKSIQNIDLSAL